MYKKFDANDAAALAAIVGAAAFVLAVLIVIVLAQTPMPI